MTRKLEIKELNRLDVVSYKRQLKRPVTIILDNLRSLNNVGSIFRTADAFRIQKIILCGITGTPPHREIQKTALGATESVDWSYVAQTSAAIAQFRLAHPDGQVMAVEQVDTSISLLDFEPEKGRPCALVFGHEVNGVQQHLLGLVDECIEIPQFGTKHSFNVSVCAGIVLWELCRKMD